MGSGSSTPEAPTPPPVPSSQPGQQSSDAPIQLTRVAPGCPMHNGTSAKPPPKSPDGPSSAGSGCPMHESQKQQQINPLNNVGLRLCHFNLI